MMMATCCTVSFVLKMAVFQVIALCRLAWVYQCFRVITLMMESVQTSETAVNSYQSTWHYNPEDRHLHSHCCESLKSYKVCLPPAAEVFLCHNMETGTEIIHLPVKWVVGPFLGVKLLNRHLMLRLWMWWTVLPLLHSSSWYGA
jgi:hypothetical protein